MGAKGERSRRGGWAGGRLVNAKIEILGSTDLYSGGGGGVGLARFSSPLLSAGVRTGMPRTSSYFSPAPPCDCERGEQERANAASERASEGGEVINIEIHGIIYQYFTQFNVIRADNEKERARETNVRWVLGFEAEILRFQRRVKKSLIP